MNSSRSKTTTTTNSSVSKEVEANAKFRTLFEQSTQFAGILSIDGTVIEANRLCLDACGYVRDDVLGRKFWECGWWNRSAPLQEKIRLACGIAADGGTFRENLPYFLANGTQRIVALLISPVKDEFGHVLFLAPTGTDITDRARAEKRQQFFVDLAATTQPLHDPDRIVAVTARLLADHLEVDRCAYAEVENQDTFVITGDVIREGSSIVGRWEVSVFGASCVSKMLANEPFVIEDSRADPRIDFESLPAYEATEIRAAICVPLHKEGRFTAAMAVHSRTPRQWSLEEIELVRATAHRCWEAIERARAGRRLLDSEERFRTLVNVISSVIWTMDPEGAIREENPSWCEFTGQSQEECRGWGWMDAIHPDDRDRTMAHWLAASQTLTPFDAEYRLRNKEGRYRFVVAKGVPLLNPDGSVRAWIGNCTDITQRRDDERSMALLKAAVESANDAVIITERRLELPGPRIEYVNPAFCAMTGYSFDEAIGQTPRILQGARTDRALIDRLRRDLKARQEFAGETVNYRKDGTPYHVEWRISPLRDNAGRVLKWVAVQRDVTSRRRDEEALREADRRKDEFLATLAHELRNPLAPVRTGLEVMKLAPANGVAAVKARDMMERQLTHMVRLIDDLLDVSRISRGKVELKREKVKLHAIIDAAIETSRPSIDAGGHVLNVELPRDSILLNGDFTRLSQVVSNVLTNAAKYTPDGGTICLSVRCEGETAVIEVSDTGVGIPQNMLSEVFEMFAQVNKTLDRSQGGLGIGLALVKRLVEMHDGTIEVASDGPAKGSTFTIRLPTAAGECSDPDSPSKSLPATYAGGRRVFVVDDNVDGAETLAMMLQISGHEVKTAHDGYDALVHVPEFNPDVVFLDIGLPGMNGYEVAKKLRENPKLDNAILVALTGWGSDADKAKSKEAGFDFHLTKPVEPCAVEKLLSETVPKASLSLPPTQTLGD